MAITYRTYFTISNDIGDDRLDEAQAYLDEPMEEYLRKDSYVNIRKDAIVSLRWVLDTPSSGHIDFVTTQVLTPEELTEVSSWVRGQNSDGLGEGFEQQDWRGEDHWSWDSYDEDNEYGYYDDYDIFSFDWRTNMYEFEIVEK